MLAYISLTLHILLLWQFESVSPSEVGAAVSVLLGLAPPVSLSATGSSKVYSLLILTI